MRGINIFQLVFSTLLFMQLPSFSMELPEIYSRTIVPWTQQDMEEILPLLSDKTLAQIGVAYGSAAQELVTIKRDKIQLLVDRFKKCELTVEDVNSARIYLTGEIRETVRYFQDFGCDSLVAFRQVNVGTTPGKKEDVLNSLKQAAGGAVSSRGYSSMFYDGARLSKVVPVEPKPDSGKSDYSEIKLDPKHETTNIGITRLPIATMKTEFSRAAPANMPPIEEHGRVNFAYKYWNDMRFRNWELVKSDEFFSGEMLNDASALGVASVFALLLSCSRLPQIEKAAARLAWNQASGAPASVIRADALRLALHILVYFSFFLPVSILNMCKAAVSGDLIAIAFVSSLGVIYFNSYLVRIVDY